MERYTRIYPAEKNGKAWLCNLLLLASAVVILSGLIWPIQETDFVITPFATSTPIPMDAAFDETMVEKEIALPASEWYALQLGAFESEAAAQEMARQYTARGAAGYVWHEGRYRTLAAVYSSREDAQLVREQLQQQHQVETYLYQVSLPGLQLRISGMQGQLDILQAAFLHGTDLVQQLHRLSLIMDRQEISQSDAVEQLHALGEQMQMVALRLTQRFRSPRHRTVAALCQYFDSYAAFCKQLNPQDSSVALAASIKHQTLASLHELKQVYDTLLDT